ELLRHITAVASADPVMAEALDKWLNPAQPSPGIARQEQEIVRLERRNAIERAKQEKSWVDFAAKLRANPAEMQNLQPTTANSVDAKLHSLWHLLDQAADTDRRYALDSVAPLEPMIGREATESFRRGLISLWRARAPWLKSGRAKQDLNQIRTA